MQPLLACVILNSEGKFYAIQDVNCCGSTHQQWAEPIHLVSLQHQDNASDRAQLLYPCLAMLGSDACAAPSPRRA